MSELLVQLERLLDWAATDLVPTVLTAEGMAYAMLIGVPLLIALLYLRFTR